MDIEQQIIDIDGSCRDINFHDSNKNQAVTLMEYLSSSSILKEAWGADGENIKLEKIIQKLNKSNKEVIKSYWVSKGIVSQFQLFLFWENNSKVFIELTFFPQDINQEKYTINKFKKWLSPILKALQTSVYFLRYENAQWKFGDTSESSDIICTNKQLKING